MKKEMNDSQKLGFVLLFMSSLLLGVVITLVTIRIEVGYWIIP